MRTTKGGKGRIGERVVAKGGRYVHKRQAAPNKSCRYYTKRTKSGKLLRIMVCGKKSKVQSVLTPR